MDAPLRLIFKMALLPYSCLYCLVFVMGPADPPVVQVWTAKTGGLGSGPIQKSNLMTLGGPNLDLYMSTCVFHWVWLDPSVSIFSSAFQVSHSVLHSDMLTVNHNILPPVHHSTFVMYWPP